VYTVLHTAPSDIAAAAQEGRCVPENLRFSGELSGAVRDAYINPETGVVGVTPGVVCKPPGRGEPYPMALLDIDLRGKAYRLEVSPPGKFDRAKTSFTSGLVNDVELVSVSGPRFDWKGVGGELTEDVRGTQGHLDLTLMRDVQGAAPVHLRGTWACAKPVLAATTPSDPCQQIVAAQGLPQPDYGQQLLAAPCLNEDLTMTGAVSGHATHGIKDLSHIGGDQFTFPPGVAEEPVVSQCGTDDPANPREYGSQIDVMVDGQATASFCPTGTTGSPRKTSRYQTSPPSTRPIQSYSTPTWSPQCSSPPARSSGNHGPAAGTSTLTSTREPSTSSYRAVSRTPRPST
jgi:hypothetical protein